MSDTINLMIILLFMAMTKYSMIEPYWINMIETLIITETPIITDNPIITETPTITETPIINEAPIVYRNSN